MASNFLIESAQMRLSSAGFNQQPPDEGKKTIFFFFVSFFVGWVSGYKWVMFNNFLRSCDTPHRNQIYQTLRLFSPFFVGIILLRAVCLLMASFSSPVSWFCP